MGRVAAMLLLDEKHKAIGAMLATELLEVEARFAEELGSDLTCVNDLVRHVERYRGKMLRPTLVLLCGQAAAGEGEINDAHRTLAAVVEMVHMASLVHDDILDEADSRRQGATLNALRGNEAAVMLGDYLISHAYHLCSSLDHQEAARLIASATNTVCEGELLQLANRYNWQLDEATYFDIIERKTGALCGVSCRMGALASGGAMELREAMDRFGRKLGSAFQIIDDVLDLVGNEQVVGKSLGKDLEKGKLTLPLIRHLAHAGEAEREKVLALLRGNDDDRAERVGRLLIESDAVGEARRCAETIIDQAKGELVLLPQSPARDVLESMADMVLTRNA